MPAKLIIIFKDSLMGEPLGLQYRITANDIEIDKGTVSKGTNPLIYDFISQQETVTIQPSGEKIPHRSNFNIKVIVLNESSEKAIGTTCLPDGKKMTIVTVSPWTRIPISTNASGDDFHGDFFNVEYEERTSSKDEFGTGINTIKSAKIVIKDIPRKIILTALKYRNSTKWSFESEKTSYHPDLGKNYHFGKQTNKCSAFVNDVLLEAGVKVPWIETGYAEYTPQWLFQKLRPPLAEEWANSNKLAANWDCSQTPLPGDVGAYIKKEIAATGHVGIIVADGVTISANGEKIIVNDAGFRNKTGTAINSITHIELDFSTFRRYRG